MSPHQQIVRLFCDRGAIKTIIGTNTDLVFLYMILYSIQWQASHGNCQLVMLYANKPASFENFKTIQTIVSEMGHSRKHPYHPHGGNWKLTSLPPSDVLIHLLLSETIFSPPPPSGRQKFRRGGSMDLQFWNDPMPFPALQKIYRVLKLTKCHKISLIVLSTHVKTLWFIMFTDDC